MQGLALFVAWNQIATSAALVGTAFVARPLFLATGGLRKPKPIPQRV